MGQYTSSITAEPVGFVVHIQENNTNLSTAEFCESSGLEIMEVIGLLTSSSGFNAEQPDAIGFFLFENNAERFIKDLLAKVS
ncbi:MAG: hypothetical protein PF505_13750 [Vallitaleaceae bacterium]|jgi:hypothetical protein|nr:hypothetical protein [Vallitaleaceae bacterium]